MIFVKFMSFTGQQSFEGILKFPALVRFGRFGGTDKINQVFCFEDIVTPRSYGFMRGSREDRKEIRLKRNREKGRL